jgi:hypothetical protein
VVQFYPQTLGSFSSSFFSSMIPGAWVPRHIVSGRIHRKHRFCSYPNNTAIGSRGVPSSPLHRNGSSSLVACVFVAAGMCLPSRCLAMDVCSGPTILAFRRHITVSSWNSIWRMFGECSLTYWSPFIGIVNIPVPVLMNLSAVSDMKAISLLTDPV